MMDEAFFVKFQETKNTLYHMIKQTMQTETFRTIPDERYKNKRENRSKQTRTVIVRRK